MFPIPRFGLYTLLIALPIAVEIPADSTGRDRGNTRLTVIGGRGSWSLFERGCEGQLIRKDEIEFSEAAGAIEHEFPGGLALGVRAGKVTQSNTTTIYPPSYSSDMASVVRTEYDNHYVQPTIAFEDDQVGVGAGWIWAHAPFANGREFDLEPGPSFHLRIGRRDAVRLEFNYMENLPLYSGGGYAELGLSAHVHRLVDFSLAVGTAPFEALGAGFEVDYRVLPNWSLLGRGRVPGGAALGISFSTRPPLPVRRDPNRDANRDPNDPGWRGLLDPKRPPEPNPAPAAPDTATGKVSVAALSAGRA